MKTGWLWLCIIGWWLLFQCGGQAIQSARHGPDQSESRILITSVSGKVSEFKQFIIDSLINRYRTSCLVEIAPLKSMESVSKLDYRVIVIMDHCHMGMKGNRDLIRVLDQMDSLKTVLLVTTGKKPLEFERHGIDAVTSASDLKQSGPVIDSLTCRIDRILNVSPGIGR
ncbi:MAG: hypothetical protein KBA26_08400 [Candidatus Delongbacteria bacterium]|nr:hypothetical protein [Candidatus Delongbacteria bacterium]